MRAFLLGLLLSWNLAAHAQSGVKVELDEIVDNRVSAGPLQGSLDFRVKLTGAAADKANAARVLVKEARDDRGTVLSDSSKSQPDFVQRDYNSGMLQFSVGSPPRAASSVKVKGTVELFVPARDPNAIVTIDKALAKLDKPLTSKALKAAKVTLTPLSPAGYAAARNARKIDDAKIAEIRAEGKKQGVPEEEINMAIELAKAFDAMDGELAEGTVVLSGTKADFDRVFRIEILGADGKPIQTSGRSTSSRGDDSTIMTIQPSAPVPPNASLQVFLLTDKSRVTSPFELSVPLP
ncbi:MAG: hypothetical protein ACJ74H_08140 [Thermoanaerobaculia bacterium]